ncbi:hypothetical protein [Winogradskyella sp. A3E31]|uniref:hypothetical protein n=1 Tax=Winogradskyella sp. A3E31 TaxID=3349637 RepID=UPI00398B7D9F
MAFGEVVIEIFGRLFIEALPPLFKRIGARAKWLFYLGKKDYKLILKQNWNHTLGTLIFIGAFLLSIYLCFSL